MHLDANRRRFLRYLLASPVIAAGQSIHLPEAEPITSPDQAINLLDFEPAAQKKLPPAHYGYLATGVEDDATLRANRNGFNRYYLRPRRLTGNPNVDMKTEVLGISWASPIGFSPVGNTMAFHPEGELPVCRAAKTRNVTQILSTNSNTSVANAAETRGGPVWFQLYPASPWSALEHLVHKAEDAGSPVIAVTVDTLFGRRTETFERWRRLDKRDCTQCHPADRQQRFRRLGNFNGLDFTGLTSQDPLFSWNHITRLRKLTKAKLLVKGIETDQDAKLAVEAGADGVIVSNHGGRAGETGRGTIECLPEIVDAIGSKSTVLIDGGFRRGSDVFKALALGAKAVCIGRPYIWGLAAFGQPGVERVIDMLRAELLLVMKQTGTPSISKITSDFIRRA